MTVDPVEIQKFFNVVQEDKGLGTHVSAIVGLLGEDLVLGLFTLWLRREKKQTVKVLSYSCTPGKNKGQRLDAWVLATAGKNKTLYQVEIKNWTANAIGGIAAPLQETDRRLLDPARATLDRYLNNKTVRKSTLKVLKDMKAPDDSGGYSKIVPVLAVWAPVCTKESNKLEPCFQIPNTFRNKQQFKTLHVFSATNYLRRAFANRRRLRISMPRVSARMERLRAMLPDN